MLGAMGHFFGNIVLAGAPFCRLYFPEVGTIPKPRQAREFPELGLIVIQQKTLANNHFTTGKTPTPRCWMVDNNDAGDKPDTNYVKGATSTNILIVRLNNRSTPNSSGDYPETKRLIPIMTD